MHEKQAVFTAQMPANVALVGHLFADSCLAFSLPKLYTTVSLSAHKGMKDTWKITNTERLSYQSIDRYLKHLQRIKNKLGYKGGFFVQSNNSFPMGLGLSSSSSSFSALTACAVKAIQASDEQTMSLSHEEIAQLSAEGKQSSKHSFYSPWSMSDGSGMSGASYGEYDRLSHVALVVNNQQKRINIEQIQALLDKNPKSVEYNENVRRRVFYAHEHIHSKNWKGLFDCVWEDFIELHNLFHSSKPSFSFQSEPTKKILQQVKHWWDIYDDGPLLTMGPGYVIHLVFREDQTKMQQKMLDSLEFIDCVKGTDQKVQEKASA